MVYKNPLSLYSRKCHKRLHNALLNNKEFRKFYEEEVIKYEGKNFFNFKDFQISLLNEFEDIEKRLEPNKGGLNAISYYNDNLFRKDVTLNNILIFDYETTEITGFGVSIAMVTYDIQKDKNIHEFYKEINPNCKITDESYNIHKISNEMVKDKPTIQELIPNIEKRVEWADLVVGHNVDYDLSIMIREFQKVHKFANIINLPKFDTMKEGKSIIQAKTIDGKLKDPRLEEAVDFYNLNHLKKGMYHNALTDTKLTTEVLKKMLLGK